LVKGDAKKGNFIGVGYFDIAIVYGFTDSGFWSSGEGNVDTFGGVCGEFPINGPIFVLIDLELKELSCSSRVGALSDEGCVVGI
jgi:hypothetical protein